MLRGMEMEQQKSAEAIVGCSLATEGLNMKYVKEPLLFDVWKAL